MPGLRQWIIVVLGLVCAGCASFSSFVDQLEKRQLSSCVEYTVAVGGGFGAAAQGTLRGILVTGGAEMDACQAYWQGGP